MESPARLGASGWTVGRGLDGGFGAGVVVGGDVEVREEVTCDGGGAWGRCAGWELVLPLPA